MWCWVKANLEGEKKKNGEKECDGCKAECLHLVEKMATMTGYTAVSPLHSFVCFGNYHLSG